MTDDRRPQGPGQGPHGPSRPPPKTRRLSPGTEDPHPYNLMRTQRGWGSFSAMVVTSLVLASTAISIYDLFLLGKLLRP